MSQNIRRNRSASAASSAIRVGTNVHGEHADLFANEPSAGVVADQGAG